MKDIVIAIDGPAGAGKSTIARMIATDMNFEYLDTGAMYRALTWLALELGIDLKNTEKIIEMARSAKLEIKNGRVYINNREVTREIRSRAVDRSVSLLARIRGVRKVMVKHQRRIASRGGYVVDGRDIGTRVLPDADLKIFLTASLQERARRRYSERKREDENITLAEVKEEIKKRDQLDKQRQESPLRKAEDAIVVDTTDKGKQEVVEVILTLMKEVGRCG
ncbi:MAG: (d)CMP kinase [Halanaerobiaceae bacterium]